MSILNYDFLSSNLLEENHTYATIGLYYILTHRIVLLEDFRMKDHFFPKASNFVSTISTSHIHQEFEVHCVTRRLFSILSTFHCAQDCEAYQLLNGTKVASPSESTNG